MSGIVINMISELQKCSNLNCEKLCARNGQYHLKRKFIPNSALAPALGIK